MAHVGKYCSSFAGCEHVGSAHRLAYSTPIYFAYAWRQVLHHFYFIGEESEPQGGDLPLPRVLC